MKIFKFKTWIAVLVILLAGLPVCASKSVQPDFAFPLKVMEQSEKSLTNALKKHDNPAIIQALIDGCIAENSIDKNNVTKVISRIDSVKALSTDPVLLSMLNSLQARLITDVYNENRYVYDRRVLPAGELSEDIFLWSGEQFRDKVMQLVDASLANESVLKSCPLSKYTENISVSEDSKVFYPTIYDFVAYQAIKNLNTISLGPTYIGKLYLVPGPIFVASIISRPRINATTDSARRILEIYSSLLSFHTDDVPAYINADLERLKYVDQHIFNDGSSDDVKDYIAVLTEMYNRFSDSEYSCAILIEILRAGLNDENVNKKELLAMVDRCIAKYPLFPGISELKQQRETIVAKSVGIGVPSNVYLGENVTLSAVLANVNQAYINIYDNPDFRNSAPIAQLPVGCSEAVPFTEVVTANYVFPGYGKYYIMPSFEGASDDYPRGAVVHVTSLAAVARENSGNRSLLVLDRNSGEAVDDVEIMMTRNLSGNRQETVVVGSTDANGYFTFPESVSDGNFQIMKGDDRFADNFWMAGAYNNASSENMRCNILTSLPIYHQGDSLGWVAEVYSASKYGIKVAADKKVKVILTDVNDQTVDTLTALTDEYGRVEGSFMIPKDRITGNYYLTLYSENKRVGSRSVMVSDYVAPTFRVELSPVESNSPAKGDVTLRGSIVTYSGFNLGGTAVSLRLMNVAPFSYFSGYSMPYNMTFFTDTLNADSNGVFELVVPDSILNSAPLPGGLFVAEFTAMSAQGESQSAVTSFVVQPSYRIVISGEPVNVEAPEPLKFTAKVVDYKNDPVDVPLDYTIVSEENQDTIIRNQALPVDKLIPTASLSSGEYEIVISTVDKAIARAANFNTVIYRKSDEKSPVSSDIIWSPTGANIAVGADRLLSWAFLADEPMTLHYAVATLDGFSEFGSFQAKRGYNEWKYVMPADQEQCKINIVGMKHNRSADITFAVTAPPKESPITIKAESFRDRVTPSSDETWTFKIENAEGSSREAAVMMRMYNAALEALADVPWSFPRYSYFIPLSINLQAKGLNYGIAFSKSGSNYSRYTITPPSFNTYGQGLLGNSLHIRGTMMYKVQAAETMAATMNSAMMDEQVVIGYATSAAGTGVAMEEVAVAEDGEAEIAADEVVDGEFSYRDAEVPLAFFRPMLKTDSDGRLSVTFTVPNANTTWRVNTIAFTKAMNSAEFNAAVIASKPVMVTPQVPQFMRKGDRAELKALVMNATDSLAAVTTVIEIFNPVDNSVISTTNITHSIEARGTATASCTIDANINGDVIGYRVKSSTRHFADGEAGVIPILPSVTPVIETRPFYIAPGQKDFTLAVEKKSDDSRLTLEYTENPAWYVVSALPGLLSGESSTAPQAAVSIFSAAVAEGLMRDNPEIEKFLKDWLKSDRSDTTFVSMLDRNPDLKIMLLNATPWMLDAKSDTERMTRLALLFDREEIRKVYESNISLLGNLKREDGGLAWMGQSQYSSEWATANVLMLLGRLNHFGYLPQDERLDSVISGGLAYLKDKVQKALVKAPEATFPSYAMILSLYPEKAKDYTDKAAVDNTLNSTIENWKNGSVSQKAFDALLLNRFGKVDVAREILSSIREFASYSPEKGMWWPSIGQSSSLWYTNAPASTAMVMEAFDEITPGCKEVEQIRQWLILQKEATDWKESVSTSIVIANILKSSQKWLRPAGEVSVKIDGKSLVPADVEKATGYFRADISQLTIEKSILSIVRSDAQSASWGAVYSQGLEEMTEVAAASIEGLSIEKKLYKYHDKSVVDAASLKVGDKVRVQLTIISDRDMDYVAIDDSRAACFLPVVQLPRPVVSEGIYFYLENRTDRTRIFVDRLPRGRYIVTYDLSVTNSGTFASGIATLQSQYAPQLTAHSAGCSIVVGND